MNNINNSLHVDKICPIALILFYSINIFINFLIGFFNSRGKFAAVRRAIHKNSGVHFAAKFLKRRRRAQSSDKEIKHEIAVLMLCNDADNIVKLNAVHESRSDTALLLDL